MNAPFFHFRNDPSKSENAIRFSICTNQIKFKQGLDPIEQSKAFQLGRPLDIEASLVPILAGSSGDIRPVMIQDGVFTTKKISEGLLQALGDLVQVFEVSDASQSIAQGLPQKLTGLLRDSHILAGPRNDSRLEDIWLINLTRSVDCIDWMRSDVEVWPDDPRRIRYLEKIVINKGSVTGHDQLFRLAGSANIIIASAYGREAMLRAGVPPEYFGTEIF